MNGDRPMNRIGESSSAFVARVPSGLSGTLLRVCGRLLPGVLIEGNRKGNDKSVDDHSAVGKPLTRCGVDSVSTKSSEIKSRVSLCCGEVIL